MKETEAGKETASYSPTRLTIKMRGELEWVNLKQPNG